MFNDSEHRHDFWRVMGRHHGGRGFGGFVAGFMGGRGLGGRSFRTGRKLASADLQLIILALLAEKPSHGYELIKSLEERSSGFYSPSPGMVYPALSYLEEIAYASVELEGAKKLYCITPEGRRHLEENRVTVEAILSELERIGSRMEYVRRVFADHEISDDETDDFAEDPAAPEELWIARRRLRMALHQKKHSSVAESRRIAAILKRATAEILRK
jgi:DNA-binding PadR family transcriptional regulator